MEHETELRIYEQLCEEAGVPMDSREWARLAELPDVLGEYIELTMEG